VDAVPADRWSSQSPCQEWAARDVVVHVVSNHRGLLAGVAGAEPQPVGDADDVVAAWHDASSAIESALDDPEKAATLVPGPMGQIPLEQMVGRLMCMDVLVHTWDLARAAGLDEGLDADAVGHAYEAMKPLDAMIRQPGVFGPKIDPPAGADLQTEFLSFLGRTV